MTTGKKWLWWIVFAACFAGLLHRSPSLESYMDNPDHGVQLCMGRQILLGKTPGIDACTLYGAFSGYTSALGLWLSGSLIGETVICSLGYAAALAIIGFLVSRYSGQWAGLIAVAAAYLLIARFYKWYIWLFPLLNLLALDGYLNALPQRRPRWAMLTGAVLGVGWLFRWDLGTSGLIVSLFAMSLLEWRSFSGDRRSPTSDLRPLALLLANFALPLAIWFGYLGIRGGWPAIGNYLSMLVDGSHGVVSTLSKPLPHFQWQAPLSEPSLVVIAYVMVPTTYALCILAGLWSEVRSRKSEIGGQMPEESSERPTRHPSSIARHRFLILVALIGLSTLHQAWHRREATHLIQVIPPAIIAAHLLIGRRTSVLGLRILKTKVLRPKTICYLNQLFFTFAIITFLGLIPAGRVDMSGWELWPKDRFRRLAEPLESGSQHPSLTLVREIQSRTTSDESVLIYPGNCQCFAILNRRISGILFGYNPGGYDSPSWRKRNMAAIEADPPKLVAVRSDFLNPAEEIPDFVTQCRNTFPEVSKYVRQQYTRIVYNRNGLVLLERQKNE